jgi:ESS family glutamate:Na+ symporter
MILFGKFTSFKCNLISLKRQRHLASCLVLQSANSGFIDQFSDVVLDSEIMTLAIIFVAATLVLGVMLRQCIPLFRWLFIPASVVAGMFGLLAIQFGERWGEGRLVDASLLSQELGRWPGWLIAVVFAGMLLERKPSSAKDSARRVGQQGLMVWIIVLGETAVGLVVTWLVVQNLYDVPNSFGMLIETGFAGGHGTAAAMGEVFAHPRVQLSGGKDLGMLMATCGLVYGIVSGVLWINVGVRRGWVGKPSKVSQESKATGPSESGLESSMAMGSATTAAFPRNARPIGFSRIDRETIDPLLFQAVILACAFGIGLAMQTGVMSIANMIDGLSTAVGSEGIDGAAAQAQLSKRLSIASIVDFPLFIYTMFGGLIVRKLLAWFGQEDRVDGETINRLTSSAMDILVVAAIASLNLQAVAAMIVPFSILFVAGGIWAAICLLLISRWLLPSEHWFQLGLINYGMSTGTTATGFVLLRMIDPELDSGAAEDYALAAPLSAPFIGGGMITIALPLLVLERINIAIPALVIAGIVSAMIFVGRRLFFRAQQPS